MLEEKQFSYLQYLGSSYPSELNKQTLLVRLFYKQL